MGALLTCKDLSKDFSATRVLANLSFELEAGSGLWITGPNGAGKTTLLMILAGLIQATSGSVLLGGESLTTNHHLLRKNIGFSPASENSLFLNVSVRQNLEFWAALQGKSRQSFKRIDELAHEWGFTRYLESPVRELSSGFRRRVALARAFLHQPKLVILDEPLAFLDNENQNRAISSLESWLSAKSGVLIVTSNVEHERGSMWKLLELNPISTPALEL